MIYLLIAILCGTSLNLGFALAKKLGYNSLHVTLANYIAACGISAIGLLRRMGSGEISAPVTGGLTVPLALFAGVVYLVSLLYIQKAIAECGPGPATMFNRLSMVLPVLVSIFLFREPAGLLRWSGILLAIVSLIVFSWDGGFQFSPTLLFLWLIGGFAELSNNLFARLCPFQDKPFYMTLVFGIAGLITTGILLKRRDIRMKPKEFFLGLGIGCVNLGSASFTVSALGSLPTSFVYPCLTVCIILLTTLAGVRFFGDRFGKQQAAALALALVAVVILNL